jgi:hypothetical protein
VVGATGGRVAANALTATVVGVALVDESPPQKGSSVVAPSWTASTVEAERSS